MTRDQSGNSENGKTEEDRPSTANIPKPPYNVDPLTNNNENFYKNWIEVDDVHLDLCEMPFVGSVVNIIEDGLILFVPIDAVYRLFCPNEFIRDKSTIRLGDWFTGEAGKIIKKGEPEISGQTMLISHIVTKHIEPLDIKAQFPDWQQRQHGGILEILVRLPISVNRLAKRDSSYHIESNQWRLFDTEYSFKVWMPEKRFYSFFDPKAHETTPNIEHIFEFWATLERATVFKDLDGEDGYCCLKVLNSTPIYEVLHDGSRKDVGRWKAQRCFVIENGVETEELPSNTQDPKPKVETIDKEESHKEGSTVETQTVFEKRPNSLDDENEVGPVEAIEQLRVHSTKSESVQESQQGHFLEEDTLYKEQVSSNSRDILSDSEQSSDGIGDFTATESYGQRGEKECEGALPDLATDDPVSFEQMLESMSILISYTEVQNAAESEGLTNDLERIRRFIDERKMR